MKTKFLISLLVALSFFAQPAGADFFIVSSGHPESVTPLIDGYLESTASSAATIVAGMALAVTPGDTVYVHTGTYDELVQRADWGVNGLVLIGDNVGTSVIAYTNPGLRECIQGPIQTSTGCSLVNMTLSGENASGIAAMHGINIATANDFTIDNVVTTGDINSIIVAGIGRITGVAAGPTNVTVQNCTFASSHDSNATTYNAAVHLGMGSSITSATNIVIKDSTFDLSNMDIKNDGFLFEGITGVYLRNLDIILPRAVGSGAHYGISVRGSAADTAYSSDFEISDCTIRAQESGPAFSGTTGYVTISIGRAGGQYAMVDDVLITRNYITVPAVNDYSGLKCEVDFTATPGLDASHSDGIRLLYNVMVGAENGIDFHENTRRSIMAHNRIIGPGKSYTSRGIVIEDARRVKVFENHVSNFVNGLQITDSGDASPGFFNSNVEILGNILENCTNAIFENDGTGVVDSIMYSAGNIAIGCTNYWNLQSAGAKTLAQWKAKIIPNLAAGPYGADWIHGEGDEEFENYPAVLRPILRGPFGGQKMGAGAGFGG